MQLEIEVFFFEMRPSTMGEVYTDFDLQLPEKNGLKAVFIQKVKGTLNGGRGSLQLNSATGNIFLRKK